MKHSMSSPLTSRLRRAALILGLVLASPTLSACTQEDIDWLFALAEEWGQANEVFDEAGNINWDQVAFQLLGLPSGDPAVDAALKAGSVVANLEELELQVREAVERNDITAIEAAIEEQTRHWGFHEQVAALLLARDDIEGANRAFGDSEKIVQEQISKGGDCELLARNMFTHRINALEIQLGLQPNDQLSTKAAETQGFLDALSADQSIPFCP